MSMIKKKGKPVPEYHMKHRLTGAAMMIIAAVLVIPFLLSEPDTAASSRTKTAIDDNWQQTFKSKIQPLNLDTLNLSGQVDRIEDATDLTPALLDSREVTNNEDIPSQPAQKQEDGQQIVMTTQSQTKVDEIVAPKVSTDDQVIESGWTVRVGTYSKRENVDLISNLLNDSGFKARHSSVQTTLGEATRVWLGPYEQREKADKVSVRLKKLTGEKGYVTKHTS